MPARDGSQGHCTHGASTANVHGRSLALDQVIGDFLFVARLPGSDRVLKHWTCGWGRPGPPGPVRDRQGPSGTPRDTTKEWAASTNGKLAAWEVSFETRHCIEQRTWWRMQGFARRVVCKALQVVAYARLCRWGVCKALHVRACARLCRWGVCKALGRTGGGFIGEPAPPRGTGSRGRLYAW